MEAKTGIYGALARCMAAVGVVAKSRKNAAQGYQFRGIDDVLSACQPVMAEHGVICVPNVVEREREMIDTKNGGKMASVRLLVAHTFWASDGSSVVCTTLGEAMDSGDKASNKAMSAALKYALVETLCIPTHEDDRDTESASPEMAAPAKTRAPANKPTAVAMPRGESGRVPTFAAGTMNTSTQAPVATNLDAVGIEAEAIVATAGRSTTSEQVEALRSRYEALKGTPEFARVGTALAKRKAELTKGAA